MMAANTPRTSATTAAAAAAPSVWETPRRTAQRILEHPNTQRFAQGTRTAWDKLQALHIYICQDTTQWARRFEEKLHPRIAPAGFKIAWIALQTLHVLPYALVSAGLVITYYLYQAAPILTLIGIVAVVSLTVFFIIKSQAGGEAERVLRGAREAAPTAANEAAEQAGRGLVDGIEARVEERLTEERLEQLRQVFRESAQDIGRQVIRGVVDELSENAKVRKAALVAAGVATVYVASWFWC